MSKPYPIIIVCTLLSACCRYSEYNFNGPQLTLSYSGLKTYDYIVRRSCTGGNTEEIEFTDTVINENVSEKFEYRVLLTSAYKYLILDAYSIIGTDSLLLSSDTISNVQFELKERCNRKVENLNYIHNSILKKELSISK